MEIMLLEYVISSTPKTRIQFKWIEPAIEEKVNFTLNHHEKPQLSWSFVRSDLFSLRPNLCKNLVFYFSSLKNVSLTLFHSHSVKRCSLCIHINWDAFEIQIFFFFHLPSLISSQKKFLKFGNSLKMQNIHSDLDILHVYIIANIEPSI